MISITINHVILKESAIRLGYINQCQFLKSFYSRMGQKSGK